MWAGKRIAYAMLVYRLIGNRLNLERKSVTRILDEANPSLAI
jgi:hypothetical protein